ncbi:DUF5753 domain-containing protein [Streptomyces massasporeus]|uniref:DUF5753 domain-containing protein n=1 Tax=Streptomyces massasporeus TaxID=67324 RepID=UPI0036896435
MLLRRQHRIHDRDLPLRLKIILDESALRRLVGSPDIMRNQLEHLNTLGTQPHITVQVLPHTAGAHPGLSGPFCILRFPGSPEAEMYLERFTSHLHLRKPSECSTTARSTTTSRPWLSPPPPAATSSPPLLRRTSKPCRLVTPAVQARS